MQKEVPYANITVFILFFGIALVEALQHGNYIEAGLFVALGVLSFWADFSSKSK